jgi:hypothetical protein
MSYRLGTDFPREGFVQDALELHFAGCSRFTAGHADLACVDRAGVRWIIEAKGETSDVGLDFRTGLGQLVQNMSDERTRYALAVPDTQRFANQMARVPDRVRRALRLHWLIVAADGSVRVESPYAVGAEGRPRTPAPRPSYSK